MRERTQKLETALTAATDAGWTDEICVELDSAKRQIAEMAKQIETLEVCVCVCVCVCLRPWLLATLWCV